MAAWEGTLNFRHKRLLLGVADLWRPVYPTNASGGQATTYEEALTAVPYILDRKSAVDSPHVLGAVEGTDLLTTDTMRFPPGVEIGSGWVVVDKSLTRTGAEGQNYGQGWSVMGDPVRDDELDDIRRAGMVEAYTTRLSKLPAGITP